MRSRWSLGGSDDSQQHFDCFHRAPHLQGDTKRYLLFFLCSDVTYSHQHQAALAGSRVDGRADECRFYCSFGMAVDESSHSCFVADYGSHLIRKITFNG